MRAVRSGRLLTRGLVVDLFAGGGGASLGIEAALGVPVDIAIDHDAVALGVHRANHPATRHLEADIWEVRPREVVEGRPVALLWASPDCTHFSVARSGKPRAQHIRSLAWAVLHWAQDTRPAVICLENVAEFRGWGPLDTDGHPIRVRKGETFNRWQGQLEKLGYVVDYRVLDASHYGAPTKRRRLFLVARCDGEPIAWPETTHGDTRQATLFGSLKPVRTAAECIDWSLPCPSIFERTKPLADKTLRRIARGIKRFVVENPRPFIVQVHHGNDEPRVESIDAPLATVTATSRGHAVVTPYLVETNTHGVDAGRRGYSLELPLGTILASGNKRALIAPTLVQAGYGEREGQAARARTESMRTVTTKDRLGLVTVEGTDYQIVDIGMRMLEPHELLAAQFGRFAPAYDLSAATTKKDKVRLIGNSVAPEVAEALVRVNAPASRTVSLGLQAVAG